MKPTKKELRNERIEAAIVLPLMLIAAIAAYLMMVS